MGNIWAFTCELRVPEMNDNLLYPPWDVTILKMMQMRFGELWYFIKTGKISAFTFEFRIPSMEDNLL